MPGARIATESFRRKPGGNLRGPGWRCRPAVRGRRRGRNGRRPGLRRYPGAWVRRRPGPAVMPASGGGRWRGNPVEAAPAAVAAVIEVHGLTPSLFHQGVAGKGAGRRPVRWGRAAALQRFTGFSTLAFSWFGAVGSVRRLGSRPIRWGRRLRFADFYIGILLARCGGVGFRIIRLLPVLPRL